MTIERREPDAKGIAGRAWNLSGTSAKTPAQTASIAGWLVNVRGAHPMWEWWMVSVVHLRPIEGAPPAQKKYPTAEYEFMIFSINPEKCPEPDPAKADDGYPHLVPIDVVEQFHGVSDKQAARICEDAVRAIVRGLISPDQDYRSAWNRAIQVTAEHFRSGAHVEN
jgi:hypothetical protein